MVDTVRTLPDLQSILADNNVQAISPQDLRDFLASAYSFLQTSLPAWVDSTALHSDDGNYSRMRLGRAGFIYRGASYNDEKKAGTLLQSGDYPDVTDGRGARIGSNNASWFLTMNDLPSELGGNSFVQFHVRGQNSANLPNIWGIDVYVTNEAAAGATPVAFAAEFGLTNKGVYGAGSAILASTDRNVGVNPILAAYNMAVAGAGGGWITGIYVNGVITGGAGMRFVDDMGGIMAQGIDLSLRTNPYSDAAILLGSSDRIKWTEGAYINEDGSNNLVIHSGGSDSTYFANKAGTIFSLQPVNSNPGVLSAGVRGEVAILVNWNDGTSVRGLTRVSVGAAGSGGAGLRALTVPN